MSHDPHSKATLRDDRLVVAISSRALFDLTESHELFEREGLDAYREYQIAHENDVLKPGVAFPVVKKLLALNRPEAESPRVEVVLLSRNSGDTGLRIFNSIQHYGLAISRAAFTSGEPTSEYIAPFGVHLFLSANAHPQQLRIAFDGDAVIFGDESERVSQEQGIDAFHRNEAERWNEPLSGGPFRGFLAALHRLQAAFPAEDSPIRTALVTARSAPAHKRVILTLRHWGVRI